MRVHAEDAEQLAALSGWLAKRGWPVAPDVATDADVLVPWDQDEFAAALALRTDVLLWRAAHGDAAVSVDADVWASPRVA